MLTKDLIKYATRGDRVVPAKLKADCKEAIADITAVLKVFQSAEGKNEGEIFQGLEPLPSGNQGVRLQGLFKLVNDKCEYEEIGMEAKERRWEVFLRAQSLREENLFETPDHFREAVGQAFELEAETVSEALYSDLPSLKKIKKVPHYSVDQLRHRYNCAQVQALLLKASDVTVDLTHANVAEKRYILRQSRFHRLMIEAMDKDAQIIKLSGPMTVLDKAQNYGDRLSKFFPHVLTLEKFKFEANVTVRRGQKTLKIDHKSGLAAPFQQGASHIPEEFTSVLAALQKKKPNWKIEASGQIVSLGSKAVIVPDLSVQIPKRGTFHFEFCHRWNKNKLAEKVETYRSSDENIILGVCRSLTKNKDNDKALKSSDWFKENGFLFRDFPTTKQIFDILEA